MLNESDEGKKVQKKMSHGHKDTKEKVPFIYCALSFSSKVRDLVLEELWKT